MPPAFGAMATPVNCRPYETNCVVKYIDWPATGTSVQNAAPPGTIAQNAVIPAGLYHLQSTGATSVVLTGGGSNGVRMPKGAPIDNLVQKTVELGVHLNTRTDYVQLITKGGSAATGWEISTYPTNGLGIVCYDNNGTSWYRWQTGNGVFSAGAFYDIQFTHDLTVYGTSPVMKINNVTQSLTPTNYQTATTYHSDSGSDIVVGNNDWNGTAMDISVLWVRVHNTILTDAQLTQNWNADKWRIGVSG